MKSVSWKICAAVLSLALAVMASFVIFRIVAGDWAGLSDLVAFVPVLVGLGFGVRGAWRRAKGTPPVARKPLSPWGKALWIVVALFLSFWALSGFLAVAKAHDLSIAIGCLVIGGLFLWGAVGSWMRVGATGRSDAAAHFQRGRDPKTGEWPTWDRRQ
ncbi:hypothetical protein ACFWVC_16465 [Streptomyces sp. NPDC058691]|uniref:hypothetical protein n=1 Tax=Streptomyces sp. NPDC058691 TaxID=3346601 RepID=UPI00365B6DE6